MGIRNKLLLPLLLILLVIASYLHFWWKPAYLDDHVSLHKHHVVAHIDTLGKSLISSLLEEDISSFYGILDDIHKNNKDWVSISLYDKDGSLLYPLNAKGAEGQNNSHWQIIQDINYLGTPLGKLIIFYNNATLYHHLEDELYGLYAVMGSLVIAVLMVLLLSIEMMIIRPVTRLSVAADKIRQGIFDAFVGDGGDDEVGLLARNFNLMRANILKTQQSLKTEIEERRNIHYELQKRTFELEDQKFALDQHSIVSIANNRNEFIYVNDKFCEISGYDRSELIGLNQFMMINNDFPEEYFNGIINGVLRENVWKGELHNIGKDGKEYYTETTIVPFMGEANVPYQYISIHTDITNLKQAKDELLIKSNQMQQLMGSSPTVILSFVPSGDFNITYVSNNVFSILGYSSEELLSQEGFWNDHIHPEDRKNVYKNLTELFVSGFHECDYRFRHATGRYLWFSSQMRLLLDDNDEPKNIIVTLTDITERKHISDALNAITAGTAGQTYAGFFDELVKHLAISLEVSHVFVNAFSNNEKLQIKVLSGWSRGNPIKNTEYDLANTPCNEVVVSGEVRFYPENVQSLFPDDAELVSLGAEAYLGIPFFSGSGEMLGHLVVMDNNPMSLDGRTQEICKLFAIRAGAEIERQMVLDELEQKKLGLNFAQELAHVGSWDWSVVDNTLLWSDQQYRQFGYEPGEVTPSYEIYLSHVHPDDRDRVNNAVMEAVNNAAPYEMNYKIIREDGQVREVYDSVEVFYDETGKPASMSGALQDITEQKNVEQKLLDYRDNLQEMVDEQTQELIAARDDALSAERAMSAFLANMSHELRTPLHGILSFSRFGMKKINTAPKEKIKEYFSEIHESGTGLLLLVSNLLDLSKLRAGKTSYEYADHDMADVANQVISSLSALQQEKDINIKASFTDEFFVTMDREHISQVFRNLLINAIKYSSALSTIEVSISPTESSMLEVSVCDEGVGIPEDELEIIFDPFIQSSNTKTGAGGTGLGLPISREIIENGHHGWIRAENRPEVGVCITFAIPERMQE